MSHEFFSFKVGHMPIKIKHDYLINSQYPRLDNEMKPFRPDLGETENACQSFLCDHPVCHLPRNLFAVYCCRSTAGNKGAVPMNTFLPE